MEKNKFLKIRAEIDEYSNGYLYGWLVSNKPSNHKNQFNLVIDDSYRITSTATNYRPDLHALGVSNGLVGFKTPLFSPLLDDKKHTLKILDSDNQILTEKKIKLAKTTNMTHIESSILSIQKNNISHTVKKIAYLASYLKTPNVPKFLVKLAAQLKKDDYTIVFIFALDQSLENKYIALSELNADIIITRKNIGYDFGSWATAILSTRELLFKTKHVLFINDSMIGPFFNLANIIASFEKSKANLWGICDSFAHRHHLQSYFFGFHPAILQSPHFDSFFLFRTPLPIEKKDAVEHYELSLLNYFKQHDFSYQTLFKYSQLIEIFHKNASKILSQFDTNRSSDSFYQNKQSNLSMTIQPISFLINTLSQIENSIPLNPSHYFSHEILEAGFPFIKKELLFKNPVNNPLVAYNRGISLDPDTNSLVEDVFCIEDSDKYPAFINMP